MDTILHATAPVQMLIGLGWLAARWRWLSADQGRALGRFVACFCVPALMLRTLMGLRPAEVLRLDVVLPYAVGSLATFALVHVFARMAGRRPHAVAAIEGLGAAGSNSMFVGLPVLLALLGPTATLGLALVQLVENLLVIPLGLLLIYLKAGGVQAGSGRAPGRGARLRGVLGATARSVLHNPLVLSVLAGLALSALSVRPPGPVDAVLRLLAGAAAPAALCAIGVALAGLRPAGQWPDLLGVAGAKLLLHPLAVLLALQVWAPADPLLWQATLLFAAMPMMSIYPIFGQRAGQEGLCAGALLAATIASVVTVPGWVLLARNLGG